MKIISYERVFMIRGMYDREGHERLRISHEVDDSTSDDYLRGLFLKVMNMHEAFEGYRAQLLELENARLANRQAYESYEQNLQQIRDAERQLQEGDQEEMCGTKKLLKKLKESTQVYQERHSETEIRLQTAKDRMDAIRKSFELVK